MSIANLWPFHRKTARQQIEGDAERLLGLWGDTAYDIARDLAWRENCGLLQVTVPGHWAAVAGELGSRMGIAATQDRTRIAA